jgi:malonate-semialdehyde dehydrogenase (acetylating)/methylmalonate-semialdehyde dehydrogenase
MPDVDMDNAVNQLLGAALGSSGERCMALSEAVAVGDAAGYALVEKMQKAITGLSAGAYDESSHDFGPIITCQHKDEVVGYIDSAEQQGAKIVVDGRHPKVDGYENGFLLGRH